MTIEIHPAFAQSLQGIFSPSNHVIYRHSGPSLASSTGIGDRFAGIITMLIGILAWVMNEEVDL